MVIRHIITILILGIVVAIPFGLVTISNNYQIISKKDNKSLSSVNSSSLVLNSVELEMLSLLSNREMYRSVYLTDSVYSKADKLISNRYQANPFLSEENLSSNLLIADLSTVDLDIDLNSLLSSDTDISTIFLASSDGDISSNDTPSIDNLSNDMLSSDKNIYISIDDMGNIDQEIVLISNELNELNKLLETELLVNNIGDFSDSDRSIYISIDEQGNIDQETTVAEGYEDQFINRDTVTDTVLVNIDIDNVDNETVENLESVGIVVTGKMVETALLPNSYRDISMNERDIYSSLNDVDDKDEVAEKIVVTHTDEKSLGNQDTVIETAFAKIDIVDNIDTENLETVEMVETVKVAKTVEAIKTDKTVEAELFTSSDTEILSNDINLYGMDMLDTTTIEMMAYSNYITEDRDVSSNVVAEEVDTEVISADLKEAETKELQVALVEAKELQVALAEAKEAEAREYEEDLTNLASAGSIALEFASLSPSLVNRSLSIDLSIGRTDIETPLIVEDIKNSGSDLILIDNHIEQKEKMEVIVVDRSNREIKDGKYYYSDKSIATIPSTVLESTVKGVEAKKIRILELSSSFKVTNFISVLYSSRQCKSTNLE